MPFSTRRSSTRGTPRGLFGKSGWMIAHSSSLSSCRRIETLLFRKVEIRTAARGESCLWGQALVAVWHLGAEALAGEPAAVVFLMVWVVPRSSRCATAAGA